MIRSGTGGTGGEISLYSGSGTDLGGAVNIMGGTGVRGEGGMVRIAAGLSDDLKGGSIDVMSGDGAVDGGRPAEVTA